ncbi:imm11 family protein [Phocaeicola sp.]|uniref:imm11 family protein n=1 Tax=Phocaeicola sp. TaxID=2773926 RepID=UPI003AB3D8BE
MNIKYYKIIVKGNDKIGGVLYAPDNWPYPIAKDGEEVKNWNTLIVKLRDGEYRPFHLCIGGANLVNQEMKELFETFIKNNDDIEFLPVKTVSEIYGDRIYYIMHFKKIFDVIDRKKTIYVEGTDSILKLRLDYDKVKSLNIFNSQPVINDIIVSEQVKKSIKKTNLI